MSTESKDTGPGAPQRAQSGRAGATAGNVDAAELAHFDTLAGDWWDLQGELRTLHHLNPVRVEYIASRVGLTVPAGLHGRRTLDVGCGGGILSEALARRGARVTGIDLSDSAIAAARLHLHESGLAIDYQRGAAEHFAAANPGAFELVTCLELLEHVPDPASTVAACARAAAPGADLFFSTLNRTAKAYLTAVVGAEYVLSLLPRGTHDYARFIRPSELEAAGRDCDLELVHLTGLTYNPLTRGASLSRDVSVNYMAHFKRPA